MATQLRGRNTPPAHVGEPVPASLGSGSFGVTHKIRAGRDRSGRRGFGPVVTRHIADPVPERPVGEKITWR